MASASFLFALPFLRLLKPKYLGISRDVRRMVEISAEILNEVNARESRPHNL